MKLKTEYGEYKLQLIKDQYRNNGKLYFGLQDIENGEFFSDITVNLEKDPVYNSYNFIDWDFINCCFSYIGDCKERLKENLNIKDFGLLGDYYYFTL